MFQYVLDTDTLSLLRRGNESVLNRLSAALQGSVAVTVITVEEQLSGWYALLRKSQSGEALEKAYNQLTHTTRALATRTRIFVARYPTFSRFREGKTGCWQDGLAYRSHCP
jgi:tRNA(fMet)-specific endonuclease VapC